MFESLRMFGALRRALDASDAGGSERASAQGPLAGPSKQLMRSGTLCSPTRRMDGYRRAGEADER